MADDPPQLPRFTQADLPDHATQADVESNRFTEAALERHKREGLFLAVRARWVALVVVGVMLPFLNPNPEVVYYHVLLLTLGLVGWAQLRVGRVGHSGPELALMFVDLALMTVVLVLPNPFSDNDWPTAVNYRFGNFIYFFVILAAGTMAYSWRTITAIGTWTAGLWMIGALSVWYFGQVNPEFSSGVQEVFAPDVVLSQIMDPNTVDFGLRIQEVVVFLIVAVILALSNRRFNRLLLGNAALERERENLSRYFSPNVVAELSQNDEPLKQTRTHDVAVLFVDIVGFTEFAAHRPPGEVIEILRGFHARMETEVFRHGGTLDKYLGDGLMATFGTPVPTGQDAINALHCARAMIESLALWNAERVQSGERPIKGSFGLHYGPVVLGNIGANRLEFAVIGNTVNVASRIEKLTRDLSVDLAVSANLRDRALAQAPDDPALATLMQQNPQVIRGLEQPMAVWTRIQ